MTCKMEYANEGPSEFCGMPTQTNCGFCFIEICRECSVVCVCGKTLCPTCIPEHAHQGECVPAKPVQPVHVHAMDAFTRKHLADWAEREFRNETERASVVTSLTELWESDAEYFNASTHSWWELLDIVRRNRRAS